MVCFIISDFMDKGFDKSLKIAKNKHDVMFLEFMMKRSILDRCRDDKS